MSFEICEVEIQGFEDDDFIPERRIVVSAETAKETLENLIVALNEDEIDIDNCFLELVEV